MSDFLINHTGSTQIEKYNFLCNKVKSSTGSGLNNSYTFGTGNGFTSVKNSAFIQNANYAYMDCNLLSSGKIFKISIPSIDAFKTPTTSMSIAETVSTTISDDIVAYASSISATIKGFTVSQNEQHIYYVLYSTVIVIVQYTLTTEKSISSGYSSRKIKTTTSSGNSTGAISIAPDGSTFNYVSGTSATVQVATMTTFHDITTLSTFTGKDASSFVNIGGAVYISSISFYNNKILITYNSFIGSWLGMQVINTTSNPYNLLTCTTSGNIAYDIATVINGAVNTEYNFGGLYVYNNRAGVVFAKNTTISSYTMNELNISDLLLYSFNTIPSLTSTGGTHGGYITPTGSQVYTLTSPNVYYHTLNSTFTTCTYVSTVNLNTASGGTRTWYNICISDNGSYLYAIGYTTSYVIYRFTLSTAFNVSTATLSGSITLSNYILTSQVIKYPPYRLFRISKDGSKLFLGDTIGVIQLPMSTSYDVTTASLAVNTKKYDQWTGGIGVISTQSCAFNTTGTQLVISKGGTGYGLVTLSTAWDMTTGIPTNIVSTTLGTGSQSGGLKITSDGTALLFRSGSIGYVQLFTTADTPSGGLSATYYASPSLETMNDFYLSPDGLNYFYSGYNVLYKRTTSTAKRLDLLGTSTSYNLSAAPFNSYVNGTIYFEFSSDGTKLYMATPSYTNNKIHQFNLSIAWDPSTATYFGNVNLFYNGHFNWSGFTITHNGTKLILNDDNTESIAILDMSTAWDITTAQYTPINYYPQGSIRPVWACGSGDTASYMLDLVNDSKMYQNGSRYTKFTELNLTTTGNISKITPSAEDSRSITISTAGRYTSGQSAFLIPHSNPTVIALVADGKINFQNFTR